MKRKTALLLLVGIVPLALLVALFSWALAKSGGAPVSRLVNSQSGEAAIQQRVAPDFSLPLLDGRTLKLSDLRGKVVVIDFWSSWCPPCVEEAPALESVYRQYQGTDVEFVGVAIWDKKDAVQGHVQRFGVTYPNGIDEKGRIAISYGVIGIPEKYIVDRDGRLVRKYIGPVSAGTLTNLIESVRKAGATG